MYEPKEPESRSGKPAIYFIVEGEEDERVVGFYTIDKPEALTSKAGYNKEDETRETGTG